MIDVGYVQGCGRIRSLTTNPMQQIQFESVILSLLARAMEAFACAGTGMSHFVGKLVAEDYSDNRIV